MSALQRADDTYLQRPLLILWACELFYGFSLAFAKFAILAFYWRMFKTSIIKVPIQVLALCTMIWLILRVGQAPVRKPDV
jgi:hypothetical protein